MEASVLDNSHTTGYPHSILLNPSAKINLSLVVFGKRDDGLHELHTIMASVALHDDLHLQLAATPGIKLQCTGLPCPAGPDNLVYKAARLLADHAVVTAALEINLHKRIPAGAGLGGGSSDAAACLMGLNRLWKLNIPITQLAGLAAKLGSDVPFFLHRPVAVCTGRGELVEPIPHRCQRSLLLILPRIHVSTAEVYQNYYHDESRNEDRMRRVRYFLRTGDLDGLVIQGINSLSHTCMKLFEPLRELRSRIEAMGIGPLHMSGSGSCLFATAKSDKQTNSWAQQLQEHDLAQVMAVNFNEQPESFLEVPYANI